jgi:hypothetical protein
MNTSVNYRQRTLDSEMSMMSIRSARLSIDARNSRFKAPVFPLQGMSPLQNVVLG